MACDGGIFLCYCCGVLSMPMRLSFLPLCPQGWSINRKQPRTNHKKAARLLLFFRRRARFFRLRRFQPILVSSISLCSYHRAPQWFSDLNYFYDLCILVSLCFPLSLSPNYVLPGWLFFDGGLSRGRSSSFFATQPLRKIWNKKSNGQSAHYGVFGESSWS